jgi:hypothetical protein
MPRRIGSLVVSRRRVRRSDDALIIAATLNVGLVIRGFCEIPPVRFRFHDACRA